MLKNGSFTKGWTDMPPAPGNLINQQPNGWTLRWIEIGESLFGANDKASGVPECVHKLAKDLPENERRGGPDALILRGNTTYKIFHFGGSFGAELTQTVTDLEPGSTANLIVPILPVRYNETDPYGTESGIWINGEGKWVNGNQMKNRKWYRHKVSFTVPDDGKATIKIRVKSKWPVRKDFFIDGVTLKAVSVTTPKPVDPYPTKPDPNDDNQTNPENVQKVTITIPSGMKLVQAITTEPNQVTIVVPEGVTVETG